MKHFGRSGSAGSSSNSGNMGSSGGPSGSSSGWTNFDMNVLAESFEAEAEENHRGENRNSASSDPAEQRNGASSSHRFPFEDDEVIGGDSVNAIKSRLLAKTLSPSFEQIERAHIDAQDRFEVKVEIIRRMAPLHPEGDWEGRGARALDNPHTSTGEESLEKLFKQKDDLDQNGVQSATFRFLKSKVFLRREDLDEHSEG